MGQKPKYNYVLLGLVLFVFPAILIILMTKKFLSQRWKKNDKVVNGYNMEPWHQGTTEQQSGPTVGTHTVGPYPPRADLGPPQSARQYV